MRKGFVWFLAVLAIAVPAPAYYHFTYYINGVAVPEKFDLNALPNKTVTFFVSNTGPTTYGPTDSFTSVLSQIRQAAAVWNGVATSDLRVAFGGLENSATPQNVAGGDVVFEDLPPGLLAYGGPSATLSPVTPASGSPFVPVTRSVVHLNRNLTVDPGPSYNETFFLTVVHEMGHALGLQHTFTSSAMSQATTRATTLSRPIDQDDIAGVSVLYPNAAFAQFGSISGRITANGQGVHLASVVAIRAGTEAVSAFTGPDGTYTIAGVPAGQYFVYVHSLPPDGDQYAGNGIKGPWNPDGSLVAASPVTISLFFPGTTDLQQAAPISVEAAKTKTGVDISVTRRTSVPLYSVGVFGFFGSNAVKPAYVNMLAPVAAGLPGATVVASGTGLGSNGQAAPGLNAQFLGSSTYLWPGGVRPYSDSSYTYIALDLGFGLAAQTGPQHVIFTTTDYMYVLPSGLNLTRQPPPTVGTVNNNGDGTVTVRGANWASDSQIYFDGLPSAIASLDANGGVAIVVPPTGANGQNATVSVFNSDGQNSQFVQSAAPVRYSYGASAAPTIAAILPASLPAGSEATVELDTTGLSFGAGQIAVGFGTSDITVRRVFGAGPNRLLVDVSVAAAAALSSPQVSVFAGFQLATTQSGFQITPAVPGQPNAIPSLTNLSPNLNGAYPGALVAVNGSNLTANGTTTVTLNGQPLTILTASATQISFLIPPSASVGVGTLVVNNGAAVSFPVTVAIDSLPAGIVSVFNNSGVAVDAGHPAHPGDLLTATVSGLAAAPGSVQVLTGGVLQSPLQVTPGTNPGTWQVTFLIAANAAIGQSQPLILYLDGRSSAPIAIPIARPDGSFTVDSGDGN